MKTIGAAFIGITLAFVLFFAYRHFTTANALLSPIPDLKGIKVIIVSPTK